MLLGWQHCLLICITSSGVSIADFGQGVVVKVKKWKHSRRSRKVITISLTSFGRGMNIKTFCSGMEQWNKKALPLYAH